MTALAAALLGVIQGLTEFLPVSSSAHLILARLFFGWDADQFGLAFDVACHVGTLLAVVVFFRRELTAMAVEAPYVFSSRPSDNARLLRLIAIGTLPIVVVGLTASDFVEHTLRTPTVAAVALALGGVALLAADWAGRGDSGWSRRSAMPKRSRSGAPRRRRSCQASPGPVPRSRSPSSWG